MPSACRRGKMCGDGELRPRALRFNLEDGCARNGVVLQRVQGTVSLVEPKHLHMSFDWYLGGNTQKILAVLTRVIRHAANHPLLINQVIVKRRNRTHMYA